MITLEFNIIKKPKISMTNNRTLDERDRLNPDVALIRKTSPTNTERGWKYVKLLITKSGIKNQELEAWINIKYHKLEEMRFLEVSDTRPIAGALFYLGCIIADVAIHKNMIRNILKPLSQNTLDRKIKNIQITLEL